MFHSYTALSSRRSRTPRRAVLAGLLSTALLAPALSSPASAATDVPAAKANSAWLADQLEDDGTLQNPLGGSLPDHGLMIDTIIAMAASGDQPLAEPIVRYLDEGRHASDYFTWDGLVPGMGFEDIITGGATAKVLVAALASKRNPRSFGGSDMVRETLGTIVKTDVDFSGYIAGSQGRVNDYSKNPEFKDYVSNNANMFGQSLAVIGLAGSGVSFASNAPAGMAVKSLVSQQCAEGYFRIFYSTAPYTDAENPTVIRKTETCDEGKTNEAGDQSAPDGDTTGFALSAMLAAKKAGATGLDVPIAKTVAWLVAHQDGNGGWGGGVSTEAPNTNSTGLIVQALAEAGGAAQAVDNGVAFLKNSQATGAADSGNALANEIGAIAYKPSDYESARTAGIVGRDTWIRASAQASLGLSQTSFSALVGAGPSAPPAATFALSASARPVAVGTHTSVKAAGLAPNEAYRITLSGTQLRAGHADAKGKISTTIKVPAAFGTHKSRPLRVIGSASNRAGARTLATAARKKLSVSATSKVKRGKAVKVTVKGLLPGERVSVKVTGRKVKRGYASARGVYTYRFKASSSKGSKRVIVQGVAKTRKGTDTFKVVK